ncbi:Imm50 family immunity protein [Pantoea sp. B65]|uniref:Imm50 family immunity protein n=1 Tax=Pantoea sp. B65 TaxID=2813359 RepID=UPI0039B69719
MWFDNALHKEKITHMFDGGLDICNAELTGFSFYGHSSVKFSFNIKGLPKKHPKKWDGCGYSAINLVLGFDGVRNFKCEGGRVFFSVIRK